MKLSPAEEIRTRGFWHTFHTVDVPPEWQAELYNYVILGYGPGGFHEACFANDLMSAANKSHHLNTWDAIRDMMKWISVFGTHSMFGSYMDVQQWCEMDRRRKAILLKKGWIIKDSELTFKMLEEVR